jgi:[ribosomal protein S18]-alanine N-acetyltransferase
MPVEGFSLRPATDDDLARVLAIETQLVKSPWTLENFRSELTKPFARFLVMTDDETDAEIAGYVVFWVLLEEAQLLNIVVDLPFRGRGMAKEVLRCVVNQAVKGGAKRITLDVRRTNQAAIQLYQSAKFAITQVRKGFYSDGEDAYLMTLDLTDTVIEF